MDYYRGVIIEESLINKTYLNSLKIISTKIERVTEKHKTPWLMKWTLRTIEVLAENADRIAHELSRNLDYSHRNAWYADFKNKTRHYIIFKDKVFFIDRKNKHQYEEAKQYGLSLGIPEYQVDFHPDIKEWER